MAAKDEDESEILLGNKQLLAVFAVVALLLAVAFTGGYMLGKSSTEKKAVTESASDSAASPLTKTVVPEESNAPVKTDTEKEPTAPESVPVKPLKDEPRAEPVLGAPKPLVDKSVAVPEGTPRPDQTFLQVGALTHTQAEAMAVVLRKQNFKARIAPRPGSTVLYRVLVGPVHDAGDLSKTRDSLRKIGFREVIVQKY